ncbi:MAG: ABC-three component system protein [Bdellovibrionota bacterium]
MKFAYEDLHHKQFEELVVLICRKLFGISVQNFSDGADGGRDSRFSGTAENYPSKSNPWNGKIVIQAKHTNGYNKSFSDTDFFSKGSESCVVADEIPKINNLKSKAELDFYILFSNRRLTANAEETIRNEIAEKCGLPDTSIGVIGVETIESYLKSFLDLAAQVKLDPVDSPLIISPNDLSEVIEYIKANIDLSQEAVDKAPTPRTPYDKKNQINKMTTEYAKEQRKRYLKHTDQVKKFLSAPENIEIMNKYSVVAEEFNLKILSKRKDYQSFDEVMEYVFDLLVNRDELLRGNKRLTRIVLFYMYWNCDVGLNDETA